MTDARDDRLEAVEPAGYVEPMLPATPTVGASFDKLAGALAKAQGELEPPRKGRTVTVRTKQGGTYEFRYAELADVIAALRAVFPKNGLSWLQPAATSGRHVTVRLVLLHESGQAWEFPPVTMTAASEDPQAVGSALTYARRYQITSAFGIAAEEDDDGIAARDVQDAREAGTEGAGSSTDTSGKHTAAQMRKIWALASAKGRPEDRVKEWAYATYAIESMSELTKAAANDLIARLEQLPDPPPSPADDTSEVKP